MDRGRPCQAGKRPAWRHGFAANPMPLPELPFGRKDLMTVVRTVAFTRLVFGGAAMKKLAPIFPLLLLSGCQADRLAGFFNRIRLLAIALPLYIFCIGCAPYPVIDSRAKNVRPVLTLDFALHIAAAPTWQSRMIDCSSQNVRCVLLPDKFVLAIPRNCSSIVHANYDVGNEYHFSMVAPMPHLSWPAGSFSAREFPSALLFYDPTEGFVIVRFTTFPPSDERFDPNLFSEEYRINMINLPEQFRCTQ